MALKWISCVGVVVVAAAAAAMMMMMMMTTGPRVKRMIVPNNGSVCLLDYVHEYWKMIKIMAMVMMMVTSSFPVHLAEETSNVSRQQNASVYLSL
jgi:hypothetical protein